MGNKEYSVELSLNKEGTKKFADATEANVGKTISIIYDGEAIGGRSPDSDYRRAGIHQEISRMMRQKTWHQPSVYAGESWNWKNSAPTWWAPPGRTGNQHQSEGRRDWTCHCIHFYDFCIFSAGTCFKPCAGYIYGTCASYIKCV